MYYITIIPHDHRQPIKQSQQVACPDLGQLQLGVGGSIETIPHWYRQGDKRCVAFCNEEGKLQGLPVNDRACDAWIVAANGIMNDILVGDIIIVAADTEQEMEQL